MKTAKDIEAFLERVGKRLSESPRASHSGKHRVAFTALRPLIEAMLGQGYTMMATWDSLRAENELSMSYETFRTHCRRAGLYQPMHAPAPNSLVRSEPPRSASVVAARLDTSAQADAPRREFRHERVPRKGKIYG